MQIQSSIYSLPRNNYYNTKPSFNGGAVKNAERVVKEFNLGAFRNGKIGKIAVKKANGETALLQLEKHTMGDGKYDTYYLKNDKNQLVGFIDITIHKFVDPILPKGIHYTNKVYVSNINNYSRSGEEHYDSTLEEYKGIGTRLMQIALKRSEEAGCHGNIELHASTEEVKNFYKKLGLVEDLSDKYYYYHENKMYLPQENKEILRHKNGELEIILPDSKALLSRRTLR